MALRPAPSRAPPCPLRDLATDAGLADPSTPLRARFAMNTATAAEHGERGASNRGGRCDATAGGRPRALSIAAYTIDFVIFFAASLATRFVLIQLHAIWEVSCVAGLAGHVFLRPRARGSVPKSSKVRSPTVAAAMPRA